MFIISVIRKVLVTINYDNKRRLMVVFVQFLVFKSEIFPLDLVLHFV